MEVFIYYSDSVSYITPSEVKSLHAGATFETEDCDVPLCSRLSWHDLSIELNLMPAEFIPEHLAQLTRDILGIGLPNDARRTASLLSKLNATRSVITVQVEPGLDPEGRARLALARLAVGMRAIVLTSGALFSTRFQLLLAPDGSYDPAAEIVTP